MSIDDEADALLKRWSAQQNRIQGLNPNINQLIDGNLSPDQSPHLVKEGSNPSSPDQTPRDPVNSVRPMDFSIKKSPSSMPKGMGGFSSNKSVPGNSPPSVQMSGTCSQCGTMHPPVADGRKCPLAPLISDPSKVGGLDDMIINKHLVDMRNIIMSQVTSKGIKDGKKFFQYAIVELTKALEVYNE
ncbi:MAG TPA: hypothetical protein VMX17_08560 [Candidatus Glassbacteria bacterium]|nr:hypothetical protein [Candidatus Glassbacteria bacterium]